MIVSARDTRTDGNEWARIKRRYHAKMLREFVIMEDEMKALNKQYPGQYDEHVWTRLRYVSQEEIDRVAKSQRHGFMYGFSDHAVVQCYYSSGYRVCDHIFRPGYYRVEPLTNDAWCFETSCNGGIPLHHANYYVKTAVKRIADKDSYGRQRGYIRKAVAMSNRAAEEHRKQRMAIAMKDHAQYVSIRMNKWSKGRRSVASEKFFASLAMAGAMGKAS